MTPAQKYENDVLDIYDLTEADFALADYMPVADASAGGDAFKLILSRLLAVHQPAQGRLSLESGIPVSSTDQTAKTTLYFVPYGGKYVTIYDDTRWVLHEFTQLSLSLSGYTASKPYDIWIYSNGGTPTLDSTIWTDDSTRATALVLQDGIYVKSSNATRRYLGTIRITGTTGQCEDSIQRRFVWNYYNRIRHGGGTWNTNGSWTYATAAWRESNNGSGHTRFEFVIGVTGEAQIHHLQSAYGVGSAGIAAYGASALDATNNNYCTSYVVGTTYVNLGVRYYNPCRQYPTAGYHYATQVEYSSGATGTFYDGNTSPLRLSQFMIEG